MEFLISGVTFAKQDSQWISIAAQAASDQVEELSALLSQSRKGDGAVLNFSGSAGEAEPAYALLKELEKLQEDWDGYGAVRIKQQTTHGARYILGRMPVSLPFPEITPNPTGTLSLDWETSTGTACIEVGVSRYSMYIAREDAPVQMASGLVCDLGRNILEAIAGILYPQRNVAQTITEFKFVGDRSFAER